MKQKTKGTGFGHDNLGGGCSKGEGDYGFFGSVFFMGVIMKLAVVVFLGMMVFSGCRSTTPAKISDAELKAIRDSHYILEMVPAGSDYYQFVTCHQDVNKQPLAAGAGCSNAFMDSSNKPILISKAVVQSTKSAMEDPESKVGEEARGKLIFAGAVGSIQGIMAGGVTLGAAYAVKKVVGSTVSNFGRWVVVPGVVVVGLSTAALVFLNKDQKGLLGIYQSRMKGVGQEIARKGASVAADTAAVATRGILETLAEKEEDAGKTTDFQVVVWGASSRTLKNSWEDIVSTDAPIAKSVGARIPDVLPVLASLLESIGWVEEGKIHAHCLPRHVLDHTQGALPHCLSLTESWSTGGPFRYVKPTHSKAITGPLYDTSQPFNPQRQQWEFSRPPRQDR